MNDKQRKYIDYRGQGYGKAQSYMMSGYSSKNPSQAVYALERESKVLKELSEILSMGCRARELTEADSAINRQIDALALQECAEKTIAAIEGADGETARRIQFYRNIINGKTKTKKKTTTKNAAGEVTSIKEIEVDDVSARMAARRELDKILGLTMILPDVDRLQVAGITINIVDASKKEEPKEITVDAESVETVREEDVEEVEETEDAEDDESK